MRPRGEASSQRAARGQFPSRARARSRPFTIPIAHRTHLPITHPLGARPAPQARAAERHRSGGRWRRAPARAGTPSRSGRRQPRRRSARGSGDRRRRRLGAACGPAPVGESTATSHAATAFPEIHCSGNLDRGPLGQPPGPAARQGTRRPPRPTRTSPADSPGRLGIICPSPPLAAHPSESPPHLAH
jgi:hypothetical protein